MAKFVRLDCPQCEWRSRPYVVEPNWESMATIDYKNHWLHDHTENPIVVQVNVESSAIVPV